MKFPNAIERTGGKLDNGAELKASILHYGVGNVDFEVRFYFLENLLEQVTLHSNDADSQTPNENFLDAKTLEATLRIKYGDPISKSEKSGSFNKYHVQFYLNDINISLLFLSVGDKFQVLNIVYQERLAKAADKL